MGVVPRGHAGAHAPLLRASTKHGGLPQWLSQVLGGPGGSWGRSRISTLRFREGLGTHKVAVQGPATGLTTGRSACTRQRGQQAVCREHAAHHTTAALNEGLEPIRLRMEIGMLMMILEKLFSRRCVISDAALP